MGRTKRITDKEAKIANPPANKNADVNEPERSTRYPVKAGPIIPAVFAKKCINPPTDPTLLCSTTSWTIAQYIAPVKYRKNTENATNVTALTVVVTRPAPPIQTAEINRQVTSTTFLENKTPLFVNFLKTKSETNPPEASPINPTIHGIMVITLISLTSM